MARSSWLDDKKTNRQYMFPDGTSWVVQNEYRPIKCPDCTGQQYCRLTHIWHFNVAGACSPECHLNLNTSLAELKTLIVTYIEEVGVSEVEDEIGWVLMKGNEIIARATV